MKNAKYLTFLILLIKLYNIISQTFEVTPVYPYCINGTAFIANLEEYKEDYLYFRDRFYDSCNYDDYNEEKEEVKYYNFNSDINIINNNNLLYYTMIEKNEDSEIKIEEIKDLNWIQIKSLKLNETKKDDYSQPDFNWFYKIKKEEKKNMVLFRISKNGNKEGSVSMYTLSIKPDFIDEQDEDSNKEKDENIDKTKDQEQETEKDKEKNDKEEELNKFKISSGNYLSKISYILLILFFNLI